MEPGGLMPHSQGLSNNLNRINPIPRTDIYFFKFHSNIVNSQLYCCIAIPALRHF